MSVVKEYVFNDAMILLLLLMLVEIVFIIFYEKLFAQKVNTHKKRNFRLLYIENYRRIFVIIFILLMAVYFRKMMIKMDGIEEKNQILEKGLLIILGTVMVDNCLRFKYNFLNMIRWFVNSTIYVASIIYFLEIVRGLQLLEAKSILCLFEIVILELIYIKMKEYSEKCGEEMTKVFVESDVPCTSRRQLYGIRHIEASELNGIIENQDPKNSFAIMVRGEWGCGKTSLINGFREIYKQYDYIYVSVGYYCNEKSLIEDVQKQLRNIFKQQLFFDKSDYIIKKYFEYVAKLSVSFGDSCYSKLLELVASNDSYEAQKESINSLLDKYYEITGRRIIIIIDDMERSPIDNVKGIFALLLEIFRLNNCVTLLLCDYDRLIEAKIDKNYINKYVNQFFYMKTIKANELCAEIMNENVIDSSYDGDRYNNVSEYKEVFMLITTIINDLQNIGEEIQVNKEAFCGYIKSENIQGKLQNARVQTRLWNRVKKNAIYLIKRLKDNDNNLELLQQYDWGKVIVFEAFIACVVPDLYDDLIKQNSLSNYEQLFSPNALDNNRYYRNIIYRKIKNKLDWEKNREAFSELVYVVPDYDYSSVSINVLRQELDGGNLKQENIENYINLIIQIGNINKYSIVILDYIMKHDLLEKFDVIISLINRLTNSISIDEYVVEAFEKLKLLFDKLGLKWNNSVLSMDEYFNINQMREEIKAQEEAVRHAISFRCACYIDFALRNIAFFKGDIKTIDGSDNYPTTSIMNLAKKLKIWDESESRYKELNEREDRDLELTYEIAKACENYVDITDSEIKGIEREYSYYRRQISKCEKLLNIWKNLSDNNSAYILEDDEIELREIFKGKRLAQNNLVPAIKGISTLIGREDDDFIKGNWEYVMSIARLAIIEVSKKDVEEEYRIEILNAVENVYSRYKEIIDEASFAEYYWMGIEIQRYKKEFVFE